MNIFLMDLIPFSGQIEHFTKGHGEKVLARTAARLSNVLSKEKSKEDGNDEMSPEPEAHEYGITKRGQPAPMEQDPCVIEEREIGHFFGVLERQRFRQLCLNSFRLGTVVKG